MGIRVKKVDDGFGIWDSFSCEFVNPATLQIKKKDIEEYMKTAPFPESSAKRPYTIGDMIYDMTTSEGSFIIPGTEEQAEWIAEMVQTLL